MKIDIQKITRYGLFCGIYQNYVLRNFYRTKHPSLYCVLEGEFNESIFYILILENGQGSLRRHREDKI